MKKVLTLFCGVFLCLSLSAMTANEIDESGTVYRKGSKKNITITNVTTINGNASYLVGESCTTAIQLTRGSYSQNPINLEEAGFSGIRPTECTDSSTEIRDAWDYYLPQTGKVNLQIVNLMGQPVAILEKEAIKNKGLHIFYYQPDFLENGTYFILLEYAEVLKKQGFFYFSIPN